MCGVVKFFREYIYIDILYYGMASSGKNGDVIRTDVDRAAAWGTETLYVTYFSSCALLKIAIYYIFRENEMRFSLSLPLAVLATHPDLLSNL